MFNKPAQHVPALQAGDRGSILTLTGLGQKWPWHQEELRGVLGPARGPGKRHGNSYIKRQAARNGLVARMKVI